MFNIIPRDQWRILPVDCLYKSEEARERILQRLIEYLDWRLDRKIECCGCLDRWHESKNKTIKSELLEQVHQVEQLNEHKWGVLRKSVYFKNRDQYLLHPESCL